MTAVEVGKMLPDRNGRYVCLRSSTSENRENTFDHPFSNNTAHPVACSSIRYRHFIEAPLAVSSLRGGALLRFGCFGGDWRLQLATNNRPPAVLLAARTVTTRLYTLLESHAASQKQYIQSILPASKRSNKSSKEALSSLRYTQQPYTDPTKRASRPNTALHHQLTRPTPHA